MLNYKLFLTEHPASDKTIVEISYRIVSPKKFKAMDKKQKQTVISMIDKFKILLTATRKEIKP